MAPFAIIIPTLNGEADLREMLPLLSAQTVKPKRFIILDSESTDCTRDLARSAGAEVITVPRDDFDHGGTRMKGIGLVESDCELAVFLTQDAKPTNERTIETLLKSFENPEIDVAYGRQLPRQQAGDIERFARLYNYPDASEVRSTADIPRTGFKTFFCSNSFAAYRIERLKKAGGFPLDTIFGEDALATAQILLLGGKVRYEAEASVEHSHDYSIAEEFKRYFDVGVMHNRAKQVIRPFGSVSSTGSAFVKNELRFLANSAPMQIPQAIARTTLKYAAYQLGLREESLPIWITKSISRNRRFWIKSEGRYKRSRETIA
jgi:rhamnosyltransferase